MSLVARLSRVKDVLQQIVGGLREGSCLLVRRTEAIVEELALFLVAVLAVSPSSSYESVL